MQIFRRILNGKTASAFMSAVLGVMGLSMTADADVTLNPDGVGQVLIYPYYTVQTVTGAGAYVTALTVTNTTADAIAVKVRFREGKNSREVLDFNLYLSAYDMWTAAITEDTVGGGAMLSTSDNSCTVPAIPATGVAFRSDVYNGATALLTGDDGAGTGIDRTKEGYFEMFNLGRVSTAAMIANVTHVAGTPGNCAAVRAGNAAMVLMPPLNALMGGASVLNVSTGTDVTYDASAIAGFTTAALTPSLGNELPNLTNGNVVTSSRDINNVTGLAAAVTAWAGSVSPFVDAVSATLMHTTVMNEYVLNASTLSGTDWVVTFPTKRHYVRNNNVAIVGAATGIAGTVRDPFQRTFWNGACDDIRINFWNREESQNATPVVGLDFSPSTPIPPTVAQLCWEVNVITFDDTNVLGSALSKSIDVEARPNGWARITFDQNPAGVALLPILETAAGSNVGYFGLPTIGFMVQDFTNQNAAPGVLAVYGGNFVHKYSSAASGI